MIDIRDERPEDIPSIRELNRLAFGQEQEALIVDALRTNGAVLLSLVATVDGRKAGHILFSPAVVGSVRGAALGPMAVLPEYQRQGIGGRLIAAGIQRLREMACPFIVVLGHADYYPRFGFARGSAYGMTCEWDVPDDVFMVLLLDTAVMAHVAGRVTYRREFSAVDERSGRD